MPSIIRAVVWTPRSRSESWTCAPTPSSHGRRRRRPPGRGQGKITSMSRPPSGRGARGEGSTMRVSDGTDDCEAESVSLAGADPLGAERASISGGSSAVTCAWAALALALAAFLLRQEGRVRHALHAEWTEAAHPRQHFLAAARRRDADRNDQRRGSPAGRIGPLLGLTSSMTVKVNPVLVGRRTGMSHLIRRSTSFLLRPSPCAISRSGRTGTGASKTTSTWRARLVKPGRRGVQPPGPRPVQGEVVTPGE